MLQLRDLVISFDHGELVAVDGLSFDVARGETFVVIGESGSGKSLTGMSIVGLAPQAAAVTGSITFEGQQMVGRSDAHMRRLRGRDIGIVYQDPLGALNPMHRVGAQIAESLRVHRLAGGSAAMARAIELLERVRIPDPTRVARSYPHQISGGMRQRAVFAMALACRPRLLIADEPTTALDVTIKAQVLDLMRDLRTEFDLTTLLITHDMGVVAEIADRIMVMYAGRVAEIGPADLLMDRPAHPYTSVLLQTAMISEAAPRSELPVVPGGTPALNDMPPGCRFHPRCPFASNICRKVVPPLRAAGAVEVACHHPLTETAP
ncbi:ABC transporter ATP-binding protein [Pukyongiella litopenaei]|uniref:ABC transporter ATP-binding protein n=1 Tax=Pukyongiella litopenaei TaxID=2605946 RepID=A0A2S0MR40_9RHOB|nr:ABC transporter ATP-binding protein [Pukyongiella litopenaei]AVO38221.1 ABC transporter ATP-binding protein [Pukyongiella litopenaei]